MIRCAFGECGVLRREAAVRGCGDTRRREHGDTDQSQDEQASGARDGHSMKVAERSRVDLPSHVPDEFEVFVGGVRQARGVDYEVSGRSVVFPRPIEQEGRLGFWRWTSMWLGIAGTYRKHETVDLVYELGGRRQVETGLQPVEIDELSSSVRPRACSRRRSASG